MTHKHTQCPASEAIKSLSDAIFDPLLKKHAAMKEQRDELLEVLERLIWLLEVTFEDQSRLNETRAYIDAKTLLIKHEANHDPL